MTKPNPLYRIDRRVVKRLAEKHTYWHFGDNEKELMRFADAIAERRDRTITWDRFLDICNKLGVKFTIEINDNIEDAETFIEPAKQSAL